MFRFVMTFTNNPRNRATPTKPGTKHSFIWLAAGISRPDLLARLFNGFIAGGILKVQRPNNFCFPDFGGIRKEPVTWAIVGTGEFNGDGKSDFSGVTRAAMLESR
jgi:hypothetical protein